MRRFERYDTSIPVQFLHSEIQHHQTSPLINISVGGLSFSMEKPISIGSEINIQINHVKPTANLKGCIVWCRRFSDHFEVGVQFSDQADPFLTQMVEQVCHIENYRQTQQEVAGRVISSEVAAKEWIAKFAEHYRAEQ